MATLPHGNLERTPPQEELLRMQLLHWGANWKSLPYEFAILSRFGDLLYRQAAQQAFL